MNSIRSCIFPVAVIIAMFGAVAWVDTLAVSDEGIKKRIEDKAVKTPALKETKVKVAVEDGNVVLFGTAALYIQKMLYEQIAWKTAGIVDVDNEIHVVPKLLQTDSSIERKIMDIVLTHSRYHGTGLKITVEAGAVRIGGIFKHPRDVLFLKHRVAEIQGVVDVNLQANFRI